MRCGDDEENEEVHKRPVEFDDDTIWIRGEERVVCQQRPSGSVVLGVETDNRFNISIAKHAVGGFQTRRSDDGVF